ncbi:MAG: ribbon-helix-helix domain-containing protein [Propionibacteriaceae bacterium]|jgi:Arc/MetJ-type ribon-helix-helix transcriptional regulator|nr:ribbon-helix-helix domain-containing protein [Propionibacteriaceae bacterium]
MKVSVSIPRDDVGFLDDQAARGLYPSRSAVVAAAIQAMRQRELTDSYVEAFDEWAASGEGALWDTVQADGWGDSSGHSSSDHSRDSSGGSFGGSSNHSSSVSGSRGRSVEG